jgi:hypothetical protein
VEKPLSQLSRMQAFGMARFKAWNGLIFAMLISGSRGPSGVTS